MSPTTELTAVYGHLVNIFQIKNNLASTPLILCSFVNSVERKKLSFRFDMDTHEVMDVDFTDMEHNQIGTLSDEDSRLITQVLPVYFDRIGQLVTKITKQMRQDWGREFKSEAIERRGYTHYMSTECSEIEKSCRLNIFSYTLSNIAKKRATAFLQR